MSTLVRPDQLDDSIPEPDDLEEFLNIIQIAFQAAYAVFLEDLKAFRPSPRESLIKMADRFDQVAMSLLTAGLLTTRGLALNLRSHVPVHIRRVALSSTRREDMKRFKNGEHLVDKVELMKLAHESEAFFLEFEAKIRVAGLTPEPQQAEDHCVPLLPFPKQNQRPMEERLDRGTRDMRDRLGPRVDTPMANRECHVCKKLRHIARSCPNPPQAPSTPPTSRPQPKRSESLAAHKTSGAVCE